MADLNLDQIRREWLRVCGSCDAGLTQSCVCGNGDPRHVIDALVEEVERLRDGNANLIKNAQVLADELIHANVDRTSLEAERDRLRDELAALIEQTCPNCRRFGQPSRMQVCGPACHDAHTFIAPCIRAGGESHG